MKHVAGSERSTECIIKGNKKWVLEVKIVFHTGIFFPPITLETSEDRSDVSSKVLKSKLYAFAEAIRWHFSNYY